MNPEFSPLTLEYIKVTELAHRKKFGQYFTPKTVRDELLRHLPKDLPNPKILDPACGTGEFLASAEERFPTAELEGWDIDPKLVEIARSVSPKSELFVKDSLFATASAKYDFIIGNPPYFEITPDAEIRNRYGMLLGGRANIFGLFIKLGLDLLKKGGYLAFVVPPSMNNGAFFSKVREYVVNHSNIELLKVQRDASLFHDALQMTMLLILRKGKNTGDYIFKHHGIVIFSESSEHLKEAFRGTVSLRELGFSVRTGRLVWNQNKGRLTHEPDKGIPLLWAHNISHDGLRFPVIGKKPQYVKVDSYDVGPAIVVNRITGAAKAAKIRAAIVPPKMKFVAENHCNVIFPPPKARKRAPDDLEPSVSKRNINLEEICRQLRSPEKLRVMQNITGNTQISKTELERLFPISL